MSLAVEQVKINLNNENLKPFQHYFPIHRLPLDLIKFIFSFLENDLTRRVCLRFTCRKFHTFLPPRGSEGSFCEVAAIHGSKTLIEWAIKNKAPWNTTCSYLAYYGHLECLKWAHSQKALIPLTFSETAMQGGDRETFHWLGWNGFAKVEEMCAKAALHGHKDYLECVWEWGHTFEPLIASAAARGGNLEILQWLRLKKCPWDKTVCSSAARMGHIEIVQWAHKNGAVLDHDTLMEAGISGHLPILIYAFSKGLRLNEYDFQHVTNAGHLHILQWGYQSGMEMNLDWIRNKATTCNHFHILEWLNSL